MSAALSIRCLKCPCAIETCVGDVASWHEERSASASTEIPLAEQRDDSRSQPRSALGIENVNLLWVDPHFEDFARRGREALAQDDPHFAVADRAEYWSPIPSARRPPHAAARRRRPSQSGSVPGERRSRPPDRQWRRLRRQRRRRPAQCGRASLRPRARGRLARSSSTGSREIRRRNGLQADRTIRAAFHLLDWPPLITTMRWRASSPRSGRG